MYQIGISFGFIGVIQHLNWALYLQLLQGSETRWAGTNDTPQSLGINGNFGAKTWEGPTSPSDFNCERFQQKKIRNNLPCDDLKIKMDSSQWMPVVLTEGLEKNVKNDDGIHCHTLTWNHPMFGSSAMSAHTRGAILNRDGAQAQTLPFSMKCFESCCELCVCVLRFVTVKWNLKSIKAFMTIISDTFKVTHIFWEFECLLMFAKATKWLCSVTHHQTGHVVKEKTVSFPFVSDFFETWSSLHCFVNFFVSEAEASNEAKNTGRDNTKSKRGEQHVLPKASQSLTRKSAHNSLNSNKRSIFKLFSTWKIWLFSINFSKNS